MARKLRSSPAKAVKCPVCGMRTYVDELLERPQEFQVYEHSWGASPGVKGGWMNWDEIEDPSIKELVVSRVRRALELLR